jgi:ribosomal protein S18 acetylase RimI-like enzyme
MGRAGVARCSGTFSLEAHSPGARAAFASRESQSPSPGACSPDAETGKMPRHEQEQDGADRAASIWRGRRLRHILVMERPSLEDVLEFPLPAGFDVRPVQPEHLRAIFDAHAEALRGHWGVAPPKPGDFERWTQLPSFQPLWQVAWHTGTDQVAGQVKPWINAEQNATQNRRRGETEFISVGAPWRRLGLARALISRALHAQRAAGMTESMLGVDAQNEHHAARLYEACGFAVVRRNTIFRKAVGHSPA